MSCTSGSSLDGPMEESIADIYRLLHRGAQEDEAKAEEMDTA